MDLAPDTDVINLFRHAKDLRDTWQGRVLTAELHLESGYVAPNSRLGMCLLSIIAHSYDDAMPVLLTVVFPGYRSIGAPFLCEAGRVAKSGHVMATMITRDGQCVKNQGLFPSIFALRNTLRELADRLRLNDRDRTELFAAAQRWIVCDYRIDPAMDPRDPDAKRLTVN